MFDELVVVRGGGDLGSGIAVRLWRAGFRVIVLEAPRPAAVRRTVALGEAVYEREVTVEEVTGRLVCSPQDALAASGSDALPVLVDPTLDSLAELAPTALVDAVMAKRNTGTRSDMAAVVVAIGPGFRAPEDCHAVVETNRGPKLGRVIWQGSAQLNTGEPGKVLGAGSHRVLRAPAWGILHNLAHIGDVVEPGQTLAEVAGRPIDASFRGLVRGLARDGLEVSAGMKVGDVDPRLDPELCRLISDKSLAVAGGVLEAILARLHGKLAVT